ncbi:hypothetical protein M407DRAFT_24290 [Tulasnella calospora MUT 4182]|uniref:Uncharacterized protein n=1 Tax=Tulasnella calospora MUT 4182 TaxID=1051891 RepID=A0A0C3KYJ6_9AGAM|nr:hypothetical protein M407DRAFT_24290 [Tulasnella calospora MUT 4182]
MPHYTRTKTKISPEQKASVDQDSDNGQEDHAVVQQTAKVGAKKSAPVAKAKSKASASPAKKRPISATRSDDTDHASVDDEIATKKKKVVSAAGKDQDTPLPRGTRSQTASTGVGDESDAAEPEDRADSTKAGASKTAQSNEEGTKKKDLTRQVRTHLPTRLFPAETILSSRRLKRMEPDSEDWDEEAAEVHYVDKERLNE